MVTELRKLTTRDGRDVYDMLQEIPYEENGFFNNFNGVSFEEFPARLAAAAEAAEQQGLVDGWKVPQSHWWFFVDGVPVGMCKFRTLLTEKLLESGGNVGYAVRPSARGRGYAALMLAAMLDKAREQGLDRILITTNRDNLASQRVALANGAVQEDRTPDHCHFWIDL